MELSDQSCFRVVRHLVFDFLFEAIEESCVDKLSERDNLFLVEQSHEIVAEAPHLAVASL